MTRYVLALAVAAGALTAAPSADPKPWSAAEDAGALEGRWKLTQQSTKSILGEKKAPGLVAALDTEGAVIRFEKGKLTVEGSDLTAAFENDLNMPEKQKQVESSVVGQRLVRLTPKGGEPFFASYEVKGDRLTVRYPAGCCSRSGMVIGFDRVK